MTHLILILMFIPIKHLPLTPCSNNTHDNYMRFNDDDIFRSNTSNTGCSSTSELLTSYSSTSKTSESMLPAPFREMDNIHHQICSWLCANPSILLLAYNMQTPVANAINFTLPNFNSSMLSTDLPQVSNQSKKINWSKRSRFSGEIEMFVPLSLKS